MDKDTYLGEDGRWYIRNESINTAVAETKTERKTENNMKLLRGVYLAGPMAGFSAEEMKSWRGIARERLEAADVFVLDPTRRISFHEQCVDCLRISPNVFSVKTYATSPVVRFF